MSLITPDFGLLFWMTLIFVILFIVLAKFGFPLITGMVDKRSERINESIAKAKEAEQRLSRLAEEQARMIEDARIEQDRIFKEASATRAAMIAQAKLDAQTEAAKIMEQTRTQIAAERESAIREIRSQVASISMEVAEKVVCKELDRDSEQMDLLARLVDEASNTRLS